jgi:hypothetical protein
MNTVEIRQKVNQINRELDKAITQFVLNNDSIAELQSELNLIQSECPHEFINGYCIHCDKAEEE